MAKRCPSAELGSASPAQLPNPTTVQDEIAQPSSTSDFWASSPTQLPTPTTPSDQAQPGPSSAGTSSFPLATPSVTENPSPERIMTSLKILSTAMSWRQQQQRKYSEKNSSPQSLSVPCPNCHQQVVIDPKILDEAKNPRKPTTLENRKKEIALRSQGKELPAWLQAYRSGQTMDAAKLLHLQYFGRSENSASERLKPSIEVPEAPTSSSEQGPPSTVGPEKNTPTQVLALPL
ncbi:putative uncharacterized protein DDB_G0290521 [Folsomia candida]|uniref:putative uncharacterized protein DDB_G0290521 n=1 Tax=Folsomia candida TaxID=158441 RepID=UPI0016051845|nr:putative uncharacterized protein DDB_G0290521 [Folsomia candida]